jgi:VWFA-related protein
VTRRLALALAALLTLPAAGAPASARQRAVFRTEIQGVTVNVSVRSGAKPVTGLTAADFELRDNGVKQSIETLSVERLPIDVTLLLDVSASVAGFRLEELKKSVLDTAQALRPEDRLRLIAVQQELTEVFPFEPGGSRPPVAGLRAAGGTALYDGVAAALMRAAEPDRRQLIVVYTDGDDTISVLPFETVREIVGFADAVVQFVVSGNPFGSARQPTPTSPRLREIAARSGGQVFTMNTATGATDALTQAIDDFRTSYVLRYMPAGVAKGGWHDLTVTVASGPYDVRARKGYAGG